MESNLTADKCKNILQILYDVKARQIAEETGTKVTVELIFEEVKNDHQRKEKTAKA